jgi:hypothetical protein
MIPVPLDEAYLVTSDLGVAWPVTVALWASSPPGAGFVVLFDGVASAVADMWAGERP